MTAAPGHRTTGSADPSVGRPAGPPARPAARRRPRSVGPLLAAPYALFLLLVMAWPFGYAVWMAFHDVVFTVPGAAVDHPFVGLANIRQVLADPEVRRSFVNLGIYLVINVPLTVVLSLVLATALNSVVRFASVFRVAFYLPYVTASVSLIGVWMLLFSSDGLVNTVLGPLAPEPSWLVNPALAMPTIALYSTWKQLGFFVLLYLAALQAIPQELHEAAAVDGAGTLARFRHVTVPGVRPATALVLILALIFGANLFAEPYLLTGGGGPNGASITPVLLIYQKALQQGNPDTASAIGVLLVIAVGLVSLIAARATRET